MPLDIKPHNRDALLCLIEDLTADAVVDSGTGRITQYETESEETNTVKASGAWGNHRQAARELRDPTRRKSGPRG